MDNLPAEIMCHIGSFCDFQSLVRLLSVNYKWQLIAKLLFSHVTRLDFQKDLNEATLNNEVKLENLLLFFYQNLPNVTSLKLNNPRIKLSCSDFILIARAFPHLQKLEIDQAELFHLAYDSLYSLCFFKELTELSIRGWKQFNCAGRGSSYRTSLPYGYFLNLQKLTLHNTATVLDFLANIHSYTEEMKNLRRIELVFTEDSEKSVPLLSQFLASHPSLTSVILENLKFEQTTSIPAVLRNFVLMPHLEELLLKDFEFPASLHPTVIKNFVNSMRTKNVLLDVFPLFQ